MNCRCEETGVQGRKLGHMFKANNRTCANISTGQSEEVINDTAE